jgi:hypothetical protein
VNVKPQPETDAKNPSLRTPLPWWTRVIWPQAFALDHLTSLVRYRPFEAEKDLDESALGYLADTLKTGRLFIPSALALNDPREAASLLESVWWRRDKRREIAEFLACLLQKQRNQDETSADVLAMMKPFDTGEVLDRAQDLLLRSLSDIPILSLSDQGDNFLMWSYYGRGHNGYALVFDAKRLPFAASVRVAYRKRRPRILLVRRDMNGVSRDVLATKARQRRHEREWRIIGNRRDDRLGFVAFERASELGYHATVPADTIVGVIVGDRLFNGPHDTAVTPPCCLT